jgi:two-component system sensor histidine kinase ChiS
VVLGSGDAPNGKQRALKILLIDDSEISLHFAEAVLEKAGYDVRASLSLDDFDRTLGNWAPDVILADVQMPGVSGVELCQMLKARYETAHVPVVLFSSLPDEELEVLARRCEADGYLSKVNGLDRLPQELAMLCDSILW